MNVPAIAMPFEFGLGDVGDEVVFKLSGRCEVGAAAMRALLGMNVVLDELGAGGRLGSEGAWMLAMLLAAAVVPMALTTIARGLKGNVVKHRPLARVTLPVWLFVSVTGVIVYWMLYHLYPPA